MYGGWRPDSLRIQLPMGAEDWMKWVLAVLALVLATLALEERGREVAGDARQVYSEATDQAREATETLTQSVKQQPLWALGVAAVLGYVLARLVPRR